MSKSLLKILVAVVAIFAATACSTSRQAAPVSTSDTPDVQLWHDMYAPVSIRLSEPMQLSISGRATLVRGESIHMSMRMLGIEVAIVHIDNDSTWVVDKYHKIMCVEPTANLLRGRKVTLTDLQELLTTDRSYSRGGISISHSDMQPTLYGDMPTQVVATGSVGEIDIEAALVWNLGKVRFNDPGLNEWTPPTYRRVTPLELLDVLKSM